MVQIIFTILVFFKAEPSTKRNSLIKVSYRILLAQAEQETGFKFYNKQVECKNYS